MLSTDPTTPDHSPTLDVLVQRQLDTVSTGNGAYLETFLTNVKRAGFTTRIIFAPEVSFGNRPWSGIHPRMQNWIDTVIWPRSFKIGALYWSTSPRVWMRFAIRAVKEVMLRAGVGLTIASYLGRPISAGEAKRVARICDDSPSDITIAEYSSMGPVLKLIGAATQKGVLMHDVLSDRGPRFRAIGQEPDFLEISREEEADWCSDAKLMIYASANEMEKFSREVKDTKSVWLRPEPPEYGPTPDVSKPHLVFIGTTHAGNHDALDHFIDDIWPLIRAEMPDAQFKVVGSAGKHLSSTRATTPGVQVLGRVDKLETIGGPQAIGVAPTRLATGVSIKVVEYLMLDMTCIAYPLALEGFGPALNSLVYSELNPENFAKRAVHLLQNHEERRTAALRAQADARRILSNEELVLFLQSVVATKPCTPISKEDGIVSS